ncbi:unnamed protein product [Moneuplotes crassus]|uniref:Uncharacterized protein n=1 Tax=Euplotes crassus TaxID=5936 RepID=A0AAD1U1Q1_EUPCR|nr:unnamed protein product [Moneuplotes crassus]
MSRSSFSHKKGNSGGTFISTLKNCDNNFSGQNIEKADTSTLIKLIANLEKKKKTKKNSKNLSKAYLKSSKAQISLQHSKDEWTKNIFNKPKPKRQKYLKEYKRSKNSMLKCQNISVHKKNRHSRSFVINISPKVITRAERMLNQSSDHSRPRARSCSRSNYSFTCGKFVDTDYDKEIQKLKAKHRRDMMYVKKNMNRKFKRTIKQIEIQTDKRFIEQEQNHKKAVLKITKDWEEEREELDRKVTEFGQENKFLKNELREYKESHDDMIKEIERLKKIINSLEDENDAFKQHIHSQMIMENEKRQNMCEECLQTDILISARYSNKGVGQSIKSSISHNNLRQDSFPNFVTLEPILHNKSIHVSSARDLEPVNDRIHSQCDSKASFIGKPTFTKSGQFNNFSTFDNLNMNKRRHYSKNRTKLCQSQEDYKSPICLDVSDHKNSINTKKSSQAYEHNDGSARNMCDCECDNDNQRVSDIRSHSRISVCSKKEGTGDFTPTQIAREPLADVTNYYNSVIIDKSDNDDAIEDHPPSQNLLASQPEDDYTHGSKSNFEGIREEISRRKEYLSLSVQEPSKKQQSFIKPSRFTITKVERAMSNENRNHDNSNERYRTPIRRSLNFKTQDSHYRTKSDPYRSNKRDRTSGSRPRDSIKDFKNKLEGMKENIKHIQNKVGYLRRF